jgi:hypothetical protein
MKQQDFPPLGTPAPTKSNRRSARIAAPAVPPAQPKQSPFSTLLKQVMAAKTQQSQILAEIRPFINAMIENKDYTIKKIPGDGQCLFSSLAYYLTPIKAAQLRKEAVELVSENWQQYQPFLQEQQFGSVEQYKQKMSKKGTYGAHIELLVLAIKYNLCVIVINQDDYDFTIVNSQGSKIIYLWLSGRFSVPHYDVFIPGC